DEIRALPIFFACVRTWRYLLRRAATPTVRRSVGAVWGGACNTTQGFLHFGTASCVEVSQSPVSRVRLCESPAESIGRHEVDERPLAVDLDDRQQLAVAGLELRVAVDQDLLQLEAELVAEGRHGLPRALAEVAPLCGVENDVRDRGRASSSPRRRGSPPARRRPSACSCRGSRASPRSR